MKHMSRWPVNSLHKDQWRGALTFSLICTWINAWVNNRVAGDLRRYRAHYDVTLMGHVITKHDIDNFLCYMKKDSNLFLIKFNNELSRFYVCFSCSWKFNEYCSSWDQRHKQVIRNDLYWWEFFFDARWIFVCVCVCGVCVWGVGCGVCVCVCVCVWGGGGGGGGDSCSILNLLGWIYI